MPDLPHSTQAELSAMWRRVQRWIQDEVHAQIIRVFGQSYSAGTWDASSTSGTLPAVVGGRSVAAASLRWEPVATVDGTLLVASDGSPVVALTSSP